MPHCKTDILIDSQIEICSRRIKPKKMYDTPAICNIIAFYDSSVVQYGCKYRLRALGWADIPFI